MYVDENAAMGVLRSNAAAQQQSKTLDGMGDVLLHGPFRCRPCDELAMRVTFLPGGMQLETTYRVIHRLTSLTRHRVHVRRKVLFARMTRTVTGEFLLYWEYASSVLAGYHL